MNVAFTRQLPAKADAVVLFCARDAVLETVQDCFDNPEVTA